MKRFIFFARHPVWLIFCLPFGAEAQDAHPFSNFVVIGAFAVHENAIHFTADAQKNNYPARFEMNPNRNLYYVYVLTTPDREVAVQEALRLRTESVYFDTWVYSGSLGEFQPKEDFGSQDINPLTGERISVIKTGPRELPVDSTRAGPVHIQEERVPSAMATRAHLPAQTARNPVSTTRRQNEQGHVTSAAENIQADALSLVQAHAGDDNKEVVAIPENPSEKATALPPKRVSEEPLTSEEVEGKNFYFSLYRSDTHAVVAGEVDAIDFEKSRRMATYPANAPVKVIMPAGQSKHISFVCQVFGYRKLQKEFEPANPSDELYLDDKGNVVVPFELVRLQKGDIAIMYNVFFFKDAAVMRPESRYEVNNLVELLVENPDYKIRIHGHTNGNAAGKIIRMGKADNFYSLTETKVGGGSAKKLSEERALVIKQFLVNSGISADRMDIKAWGGRKPLFDKNSARAVENVRVEIEILSE